MDKLKVIITLCIISLLVSFSIFSYYHVTTIEGTVVEKYNKRKGDTDRFYIVVKDKEGVEQVVVNKDSIFMLKFDSAEVQARLHTNKKYEFTLRGFRVPLFSMFPNVDTIEEVK